MTTWEQARVSADATHHTLGGQPLYAARFDQVLAFHAPGLAAVLRDGAGWHIDSSGGPAYGRRFVRTFGFYEGLAAVAAVDGCLHIRTDGTDHYSQRYAWCGNFQEGRCAVRDRGGAYLHLDHAGRPAYAQRWRYAGDYRHGVAVVQSDAGLHTHVDLQGAPVHGAWFNDLDVFHKGFARARDRSGWHHVDGAGRAIYSRRFAAVEPFYNGFARVECLDGGLEVIDEAGGTTVKLPEAQPQTVPAGLARICQVPGLDGRDDPAPRDEPSAAERRARRALVRVGRLLYERDYNATIDGNLSVRLSRGEILITPSGSHNGFLEPDELVVMDLDGSRTRGPGKPTSEHRLHARIYQRRDDIHSVIHVHAPYTLAATLAGIDLHQTYVTMAPVPTTRYARISSAASAEVIDPYIADYNWAILPRHGPVAWADTLWNAFLRIEGLEHFAKVVLAAAAVGPLQPMPRELRRELLELWHLEHQETT
ncbi:MAG TPA: class II aldolase/adducin family protein [Polyangia bacterium]